MPLLGALRLEVLAALEHLGVLRREHAMGEIGGGLGKLSEIFRGNIAAPAARFDPAAEADDEGGAAAVGEYHAHLVIGGGAALLRDFAERLEAGNRRAALRDGRQRLGFENVPFARVGKVVREPARIGADRKSVV